MARKRRLAVAAVVLAGSLAMAGTTVVLGQDSSPGGSPAPGGFRPACDLITADAVSAIVGATVTADESLPVLYCAWNAGDTEVASATLSKAFALPMMDLVLPASQEATIGGRAAVVSPGDGKSTGATAAVALDDGGVLTVQLDIGGPAADPTTAVTALAEAIMDGGPVTAVPPATPGVTPLGYDGSPCDLMTPSDLKDATGLTFKKQASTAGSCIYNGGTLKQYESATIAILALDVNSVPRRGLVDATVAGRPAKWLANAQSLFVDIGDGKVLEVALNASPAPKGAAAAKVKANAQALAEGAIGRMTPQVGPAATPDPGLCALLGLDGLSQATGLTFTRQDVLSKTSCVYSTADQRSGVLVLETPAPSLDAAWKDAGKTFPLPADPTKTTISGQPAYTAAVTPTSAAAAVDLAGTPGGDGQVLGLLTLGVTPPNGDGVALVTQIAEMALANR